MEGPARRDEKVGGRALRANLLLALAASVLFLGSLEGLARLFEPPRPAPVAAEGREWTPEDGDHFYTLKPQPKGWPRAEANSDGLRDVHHPAEKPEAVSRVVFLGDSVTEGFGVEPAESYPRQLQALLDRDGERVEVLSVAVRGWSTRQQRIAYHRIARAYRPDVVVAATCLNDLDELAHQVRSPPPAFLVALHRRSALVRRLVGAHDRELRGVEELFRSDAADGLFFRELSLLRDEVRRDGAAFAVALFPYRLQVEPGAPPPRPQEATAAFCAREGIPFLDLLPALRPLGAAAFVDENHLGVEGGRLVAEALRASPLLPRRSFVPALVAALRAPGAGAGTARWIEDGRPRPVPASALPDLSQALDAGSPDVRAAAAWALEGLGAEAAPAVPALVERLADPAEPVRVAAARALGAIGPGAGAAVEPLLRSLDDPREVARWEATRALAGVGIPPGRHLGALEKALESDDPVVRNFSAWALGGMGPAVGDAAGALLAAVEREDDNGSAARAARRLGPAIRGALPAVIERLGSADPAVRARAARTLSHVGPEARGAADALVTALGDPEAEVRAAAAWALGEVAADSPAARSALLARLADAAPSPRSEAARALGKLGLRDEGEIRAVIAAAGDADPEVRRQAVRALGRLGAPHAGARAALERARRDPDERVRREAENALEEEADRSGTNPAPRPFHGLAWTPPRGTMTS